MLPNEDHDRWHVDERGVLTDALVQRRGSGLSQRVVDIVKGQLTEASRWGSHTLQGDILDDLVRQLQPLYRGEPQDLSRALHQWAGRPWEGSRIIRLLERACRCLQREWFMARDSTTQAVSSRSGKLDEKKFCRPRLPACLSVPPAPTVLPFHTFTCPLEAGMIRAISQRNAIRISCSTMRASWLPNTVYPPPLAPTPHLNVGYISSDFNNHPLAHL